MAGPSEFEEFWTRKFGSVLPLGHDLRESLGHRWFRIHSLPAGKRYAEKPEEYATMLMRQGTVADAVLGRGAACWLSLFVSDFLDEPALIAPERDEAFKLGLDEAMLGVDHGAYRPGEDGPVPFRVFAGKVEWEAGRFEESLRDVADDNIDGLVWTNVLTGAVYAPYDGGADLILPTVGQRIALERQFVFWRSDREDGL